MLWSLEGWEKLGGLVVAMEIEGVVLPSRRT